MNDSYITPISNKVIVGSLQEALTRVFVPLADCVFYCPTEDCYYNVITDNIGNKRYDKYTKTPEKQVAYATKEDLEDLRGFIKKYVEQQSFNTTNDAVGSTSTVE